jgi:hypothetical protein
VLWAPPNILKSQVCSFDGIASPVGAQCAELRASCCLTPYRCPCSTTNYQRLLIKILGISWSNKWSYQRNVSLTFRCIWNSGIGLSLLWMAMILSTSCDKLDLPFLRFSFRASFCSCAFSAPKMAYNSYTPAETIELISRTGVFKGNMRLDRVFFSSISAGCLLSFACATLISTNSSPWYQENAPGLIRTLAALVFPYGLCMVFLTGADLCTGSFMVILIF